MIKVFSFLFLSKSSYVNTLSINHFVSKTFAHVTMLLRKYLSWCKYSDFCNKYFNLFRQNSKIQ